MDTSFKHKIPDPIVDDREVQLLQSLTDRYKKLVNPGPIKRLGNAITSSLPAPIKTFGSKIKNAITGRKIYEKALTILGTGFGTIQKWAARFSTSDEQVIKKVNATVEGKGNIQTFDEVCLARAYDISSIVAKYRASNITYAFIEGAVTSIPGFAGIPFNLVLSTFLYFRAVQVVALSYGYDVKNDDAEMEIAGQVFANSMNPTTEEKDNDVATMITTIMAQSDAETLKQTAAAKTWSDMASRGGANLLLTQLSTLATRATQRAMTNVGKTEVETNVFRTVFKQVGRRLALKAVQRAIPIISAVIGAVSDARQMRNTIDYADIFYAKRFILEKEVRVSLLSED